MIFYQKSQFILEKVLKPHAMLNFTQNHNLQIAISPSISMLVSLFLFQKVSNTFKHLDMKYHDHIFDTDPPIEFIRSKDLKPHALVTTLEILPNFYLF